MLDVSGRTGASTGCPRSECKLLKVIGYVDFKIREPRRGVVWQSGPSTGIPRISVNRCFHRSYPNEYQEVHENATANREIAVGEARASTGCPADAERLLEWENLATAGVAR